MSAAPPPTTIVVGKNNDSIGAFKRVHAPKIEGRERPSSIGGVSTAARNGAVELIASPFHHPRIFIAAAASIIIIIIVVLEADIPSRRRKLSGIDRHTPFITAVNTVMRLYPDDPVDRSVILLYAVSGTVVLLLMVILVMLIQRSRARRLNWYDANLLEMANSSPNYVRCKALARIDTDDDREMAAAEGSGGWEESHISVKETFAQRAARRQQSRIQEINKHSFEANKPAGDLSGIFTVPKAQKGSNYSMFNSLDQRQIDRGLYQTSMDAESSYKEEAGGGCCGSIKLSICMDMSLNLLTVDLKSAIDLVPKRQDGLPNPYFKVSLIVPESALPRVEYQSKINTADASPDINEEFFFQIPNPIILGQCRLEVQVFDYDQFSVDECIGYCWLTLGRLSLSTNKDQPTVFWAEVLPFDDDNGTGYGEVLFSLAYLNKAQRLTVNVFKARNLRIENIDNLTSNAIRVSLITTTGSSNNNERRRLKRKKTSCSKKNVRNPQFNESINFQIPKNSLCDTILEIEAIHEYGSFGLLGGVKVLGRLELPIHKCRDLWRAIIREEKPQARWYSLEEP